MEYKIIFESGVTETIEAESIKPNDVLDKVEIIGEDGKELEEVYLNFDHISAIIPQE
ncbi:hypothetical protein [Fodinibius halophilus]|uniref:Uncharacterized protein n=1 Tax=Fodinibius halophilus TaxID=1736908 RepID=A0A6M1TL54_9BACT|nr:hypothetical protein [Fodinibius halophilus]NGP89210.1 hypothetical protein [Fodinibius halophilus]